MGKAPQFAFSNVVRLTRHIESKRMLQRLEFEDCTGLAIAPDVVDDICLIGIAWDQSRADSSNVLDDGIELYPLSEYNNLVLKIHHACERGLI